MSLTDQNLSFILTDHAARQIKLIQENDYTLENMVFRLKIGGKGCGGFTYETGFSEPLTDDIIITREFDFATITIHIDPFTHYYCHAGVLDYLFDPDNNDDGFLFKNYNEHKHEGKFFKDESLVPTHLEIR